MNGEIITVHVAGPPMHGNLYQECARCGIVLQDYTGRELMVAVDSEDPAPDTTIPAWPEGERIGRLGGVTYVVGPPGRPLDDDERECRPAS
jgi:hypothetical protein